MPYIPEEDRDDLSPIVGQMTLTPPTTAGELQYLIASMVDIYLDQFEGNARYQDMNDVMGALSGASMEFYRCVVAPYEETKAKENGGVYGQIYSGKFY